MKRHDAWEVSRPAASRAMLLALAMLALLAWAIPPGALAAQTEICPAPPEFATARAHLAHVAAALQGGGALDILAVGSLTMTNPDPRSPQNAFPYQMADTLRRMLPGTDVRLTIRGGKGLQAREMLELIHASLTERAYRLVIWQTGTVDAVRKVPAPEFYRILNEGAALSSLAGANLILVDTQYSRMISAKIDLAPYEDAMRRAATLPGVMLFRRYDLMRGWVMSGSLDLERVGRSDREAVMSTLQSCLGDTLARLVISGAQAAP